MTELVAEFVAQLVVESGLQLTGYVLLWCVDRPSVRDATGGTLTALGCCVWAVAAAAVVLVVAFWRLGNR